MSNKITSFEMWYSYLLNYNPWAIRNQGLGDFYAGPGYNIGAEDARINWAFGPAYYNHTYTSVIEDTWTYLSTTGQQNLLFGHQGPTRGLGAYEGGVQPFIIDARAAVKAWK